MRKFLAYAAMAAVGLGRSFAAEAETISYDFTGTISLASPALASLDGTNFSGIVIYDNMAPFYYSIPGSANYKDAVTSFNIMFNGFTVTYNPGGTTYTTVGNDSYDALYLYGLSTSIHTSATPESPLKTASFFEFFFVDQSATAFASTELPAMINIDQFTPGLNRLVIQGAGSDTVRGEITSFVRSGVPEPSTWATMLLGLGAIGGVLRRSRTSLPVIEV